MLSGGITKWKGDSTGTRLETPRQHSGVRTSRPEGVKRNPQKMKKNRIWFLISRATLVALLTLLWMYNSRVIEADLSHAITFLKSIPDNHATEFETDALRTVNLWIDSCEASRDNQFAYAIIGLIVFIGDYIVLRWLRDENCNPASSA